MRRSQLLVRLVQLHSPVPIPLTFFWIKFLTGEWGQGNRAGRKHAPSRLRHDAARERATGNSTRVADSHVCLLLRLFGQHTFWRRPPKGPAFQKSERKKGRKLFGKIACEKFHDAATSPPLSAKGLAAQPGKWSSLTTFSLKREAISEDSIGVGIVHRNADGGLRRRARGSG